MLFVGRTQIGVNGKRCATVKIITEDDAEVLRGGHTWGNEDSG
jgi:hypothetical protein